MSASTVVDVAAMSQQERVGFCKHLSPLYFPACMNPEARALLNLINTDGNLEDRMDEIKELGVEINKLAPKTDFPIRLRKGWKCGGLEACPARIKG